MNRTLHQCERYVRYGMISNDRKKCGNNRANYQHLIRGRIPHINTIQHYFYNGKENDSYIMCLFVCSCAHVLVLILRNTYKIEKLKSF